MTDALTIPADLLPADGRFGAGPSKIQTSHLDALAATGSTLMGTSHRQAPVENVVGRVRDGLAALFSLPDGYEVVLGNGGATAFWDVATFGLIREKSQHLKLRRVLLEVRHGRQRRRPGSPTRRSSPATRARARSPVAEDGVDAYAWPHNETSTGVMAPVRRPAGDGRRRAGARRRHLGRRRPAGRPRPRPTPTTSRRRSASPPTAASGSR